MERSALGVRSARARPHAAGGRRLAHLPARLRRDRYLLYTGLLAPVSFLVAIAAGTFDDLAVAVAITPVFLVAQALLGLVPSNRRAGLGATAWSLVRLTVALLYVAVLVVSVGGPTRPLLSLYLPVVVAAAALGVTQAVILGSVAALIYLAPLLGSDLAPSAFGARAVAHAGVAILLAIATRRLLTVLESASGDLRRAVVAERRRSRQIAAMEQVGRVLVGGGETADLLRRVTELLASRFGYGYVSVYLWERGCLRLGAQQNYAHAPETVEAGRGVVGRVAQSHALAYLPEVSEDAGYVSVHDGVVSEVCAPLLVDGVFLGVLNVEADHRLDRTDRDLIATLASRVATVVALGRERQALSDRASLFRGLHEFTSAVSGTLQIEALAATLVERIERMVPADLVVVTLLERESGRYLMQAAKGADPQTMGREIRPGEGVAGRAIRDRVTVIDDHYRPEAYPGAVRDLASIDTRVAAAVPLMRDAVVIGAITVGRTSDRETFGPMELEALELLAGHASLAIANAFLHADVAALAIRDSLTGLHNRRHFDEALERLVAAHRRDRQGEPRPLAAIMFDLDRFGEFNRDHGHLVGDAVLRAFASILSSRFRAADLVARYGGEEFVAVLDGATLDDAQAAADEVRRALEATSVPDEAGEPLRVTVSAGCAALDAADPSRERLIRTADVALFMAKRAGRNRVVAA